MNVGMFSLAFTYLDHEPSSGQASKQNMFYLPLNAGPSQDWVIASAYRQITPCGGTVVAWCRLFMWHFHLQVTKQPPALLGWPHYGKAWARHASSSLAYPLMALERRGSKMSNLSPREVMTVMTPFSSVGRWDCGCPSSIDRCWSAGAEAGPERSAP